MSLGRISTLFSGFKQIDEKKHNDDAIRVSHHHKEKTSDNSGKILRFVAIPIDYQAAIDIDSFKPAPLQAQAALKKALNTIEIKKNLLAETPLSAVAKLKTQFPKLPNDQSHTILELLVPYEQLENRNIKITGDNFLDLKDFNIHDVTRYFGVHTTLHKAIDVIDTIQKEMETGLPLVNLYADYKQIRIKGREQKTPSNKNYDLLLVFVLSVENNKLFENNELNDNDNILIQPTRIQSLTVVSKSEQIAEEDLGEIKKRYQFRIDYCYEEPNLHNSNLRYKS